MKSFCKITAHNSKDLILKIALFTTVLLSLSFRPVFAQTNNLFEGYYKVMLSNVHSGYAIQSYTFDSKKKQFQCTYYVYVRLSPDGKKFTTESVTTVSNEKFHPLKYNYRAKVGNQSILIRGQVKKNILYATVHRDNKKQKLKTKFPKGGFFSTMLFHLAFQNGLSVGKNFSYKTLREEDASLLDGTLHVASKNNLKGFSSYKLEYNLKATKGEVFISEDGQILESHIPAQNVSTYLVAKPEQARKNFPFPEKTLKALFGKLPKGEQNLLAQRKSRSDKAKLSVDNLTIKKNDN